MAYSSLMPKGVEKELCFKGNYGGRFALISPQYRALLKFIDAISCPICDDWDTANGVDFGYHGLQIQAYVHIYLKVECGFKTSYLSIRKFNHQSS